MNREQLKHIFDQSSCLTQKQLKGYVDGSMMHEEAHAVELHLNSCPMCSDAVDGLLANKEKGTNTIGKLNTDFLNAHLPKTNTDIPLTVTRNNTNTKKIPAMHRAKATKSYFAFRVTTMAAAILLAMAAVWYYRLSEDAIMRNNPIAQQLPEYTDPDQIRLIPIPQGALAVMEDDTNADADIYVGGYNISAPKSITQSEAAQKNGVVAMADGAKEKEQKEGLLKRLGNKIETAAAKKATQQVMGAIKNDNPDKYATSAKNQFTEEQKQKPKEERSDVNAIEKMPSRTTAPSAGNSYEPVVEDADNNKKAKAEETISKTDQADKLLQAGKASDALNLYTQEMRSASSKGKRQEAAIGAARCYLALGNRYKAKDILISIVNEGGPRKREAKRMLKELGWEE